MECVLVLSPANAIWERGSPEITRGNVPLYKRRKCFYGVPSLLLPLPPTPPDHVIDRGTVNLLHVERDWGILTSAWITKVKRQFSLAWHKKARQKKILFQNAFLGPQIRGLPSLLHFWKKKLKMVIFFPPVMLTLLGTTQIFILEFHSKKLQYQMSFLKFVWVFWFTKS